GRDRSKLGDRDLILREDLEEVRLEGLVRPIELVDQKQSRQPVRRSNRLEQWPSQQESRREDVVTEARAIHRATRFGETNLDHLPRIIPFVRRRADVESLIALQPNERSSE